MKKKNRLYVVLLFIVSLFAMMPMFTTSYKSSHDTKFHLTNIITLTEQIKKETFPSGIVGNIGNDFGYATNLFYPPLAHTSISYMNVVINNPLISIKIFYLAILFLSGLTMYYLARKLSKSDEIGFISAVIYMLFPYHLTNIYIRDAQGEALLFVFLPLIFSSLYELFSEDGNKNKFYPLFIIGYVGGMLSHLTMMIYFTILILVYLAIKYKKTFKNIKYFVTASLFILGITSFFYVPLLEHKILGDYRVFKDGVMVQGTQDHGLELNRYINIFSDYGNNKAKYFIDGITLILLAITIFKYKKIDKKYIPIIIFGLISIFLSSKYFPWDSLPRSTRMIQYPWRFETFVALSISIIAPLCLNLMNDKKLACIFLSFAILLLAQPMLRQASDEVINLNHIEYVYGLGYQQEYMPVNINENLDYYNSRNKDVIITDGIGEVKTTLNDVPNLEFTVNTDSIVTIELPRIYYLGYTLKGNNKTYQLYENDKGFVETKVESGTYNLEYTGTKIDRICNYISIISLLGCVILIWKKR